MRSVVSLLLTHPLVAQPVRCASSYEIGLLNPVTQKVKRLQTVSLNVLVMPYFFFSFVHFGCVCDTVVIRSVTLPRMSLTPPSLVCAQVAPNVLTFQHLLRAPDLVHKYCIRVSIGVVVAVGVALSLTAPTCHPHTLNLIGRVQQQICHDVVKRSQRMNYFERVVKKKTVTTPENRCELSFFCN